MRPKKGADNRKANKQQSMALEEELQSIHIHATALNCFSYFLSLFHQFNKMLAADKAATARSQNMETYKFLSTADIWTWL